MHVPLTRDKRANTLVGSTRPNVDDMQGFKPLKRHGTFALGSRAKGEMTAPITFNDALYRRHFGAGPSLVKASSLNVKGM